MFKHRTMSEETGEVDGEGTYGELLIDVRIANDLLALERQH